MFLRLIIIALVFGFLGCNQAEIKMTDLEERSDLYYLKKSDKVYSGTIKSYYDQKEKQIKEIATFSDGKPVGTWITYGKRGLKVDEISYKNGVKSGALIHYDDQQREVFRQEFEAGKSDGKTTISKYWNDTLVKRSEVNYRNGKKDGLEREWYQNTRIKSQISYKKDLIQGEIISWYSNGQESYRATYRNGKREGICITQNNSGKIIRKELYKKDRLIKVFKK